MLGVSTQGSSFQKCPSLLWLMKQNLRMAIGFTDDHTGLTTTLLSPIEEPSAETEDSSGGRRHCDRLTSYLASSVVNEWTGQSVGVAQHGGGWSASQLEDLERKTKKGQGKTGTNTR